LRRILVWLGLPAAVLAAHLSADDINAWPVVVKQTGPAGDVVAWNALGPFLFDYTFAPGAPVSNAHIRGALGEQPAQPGDVISGFRPFYVQRNLPDGKRAETTLLYPIFIYRSYGDEYWWSVFDIINRYDRKAGAPPPPYPATRTFDVWPFYFSRETPGSPSSTSHGLFPIAGSMTGHFGYDRLTWVLFPLTGTTLRRGTVSTYAPWPFVRVTKGREHGFALWPLYGRDEQPGAFTHTFILWPFGWNNTIQPTDDQPPGTPPTRQVGVLPFYTSERSATVVNKNYFWPFFGYTDRVAPTRYHETRYFWPFLVQGRGDDMYVSRTGPFYTHSIKKGVDKTWAPWPLWRRMALTEDGADQVKTQLLYFVYWNLEERSTTNPGAAPAHKTFLWPLFSSWDNGAGRRQFQFPSVFDVFFPSNEEVRESWTPLATLFRRDESPGGGERTALLWNAVSWERGAAGDTTVQIGPLGWRSGGGAGRRFFWVEFSPRRVNPPSVAQ